jgi:hypothetical protein
MADLEVLRSEFCILVYEAKRSTWATTFGSCRAKHYLQPCQHGKDVGKETIRFLKVTEKVQLLEILSFVYIFHLPDLDCDLQRPELMLTPSCVGVNPRI